MYKRGKNHYVKRRPKPKLSGGWVEREVKEWAIGKFLDLLFALAICLFSIAFKELLAVFNVL
jgi:hypothetical protein